MASLRPELIPKIKQFFVALSADELNPVLERAGVYEIDASCAPGARTESTLLTESPEKPLSAAMMIRFRTVQFRTSGLELVFPAEAGTQR